MSNRTCSIDGCEKPSKTRGWCAMHYQRWRQHGDPEAETRRYVKGHGLCSVEGCDRQHSTNGLCGMHYQRWRKHGTTDERPMVGSGNPSWRNIPTYAGMHSRLKYKRGAASSHKCVDCGARADEWSYNHHAEVEYTEVNQHGYEVSYTTDLDCYEPRCRPCHRTFDRRMAS